MVATWPLGLPQEPLVPGFGRRPDPAARLASQMEVGPAKLRQRRALYTKPIDATYPVPRADWPTFEIFYESTLAGGTLPFDWPDPATGTTKRVRFRPGEQSPYDAPLESGGRYFLLTIKIEALP